MSARSRLLNCFTAGSPPNSAPPLLLDLTVWHKWHQARGTLPAGWGDSLVTAARALGTPVWAPFKAWRIEYDGVEVTTEESDNRRDIVYRAGGRTMLARWQRGPDGDWWQTEYPVRTPEDLGAALEVAAARRYVVDTSGLDAWRAAVGEDGIVPLELPMVPYSDVLHSMVGWGDGLALMMGEGKPLVSAIVASLEQALSRLIEELAGLPGELLLAPDNLDAQYISPRAFKEYLAPSYSANSAAAHRCGKALVVHVGGPARRLVPLLATAEVTAIEGVAGAPQGDATLAEAREAAGVGVGLWGGIPQDLLLQEHERDEFEGVVRQVTEQARNDPARRSIVGVADRVPAAADVGRLRRLVEMLP